MRKSIIRGISYCIALVMMVALVFGIIGTSNLTASAVGAPITSEIKIAHITDLHYFPFEDCNVKDPNDKKSDFYIKLATDTKLCQEAGTILNAVYKKIVAENPDYLVVSGDITRDSELQAHIDVANGLRYLQNTLRETNPDFQIFVVPGNHDLVNTNASKFDANGSRAKDADGNVISGEKLATSVSEFPKIYAGLGYPNLTAENRAEYIAKYVSHSASFGLTTSYIESSNLPNIVFHRYSDIIGYPTADDKAVNCLTYVAIIDNAKVAVCGIDSTERKAAENIFGWEHETGGRITQNCLNWLSAKTAASREANYTLIGTLHHNVAPHYAMEENLTKDFTLYNWEDTATYLADEVGLRYVFTGHMHASDRAQFTSYKGNTITDFETGSTVSLKAPSRYVTISRTEYDNKVYEDVTSLVIPIESLENIQSFHIDKPTTFEVHPEYFAFQQVTNLTDMIEKGLYDLLIRRLVDGFVNEGLQSMLYDLVDGVIPPSLSLAGLKLELPQTALMKVVNIVLDDLFNNLTYVYDGKSYDNLISVAHALVNGVLNIVVYTDGEEAYTLEQVGIKMYKEHLIGGEAADYAALDAKFKGLSERLLTTDLKQNTIKQLADILLNTLIMNKDSLIPVLLSHKFDISGLTYDASITDPAAASKRFTAKEQADITKLFNVLRDLAGIDILDKGYICLNEIVELPLVQSLLSKLIDTKGMPLLDFVYDALGKYLTTSFYTGLGGIVNNIVMAFSIDDTFDGHTADISKTNFHELYTYRVDNGLNMGITVNGVKFGTAYDGEPHFTTATYADGRLPSHATATFGDKTNTSVNLSFYTNHEVNGLVKYRVKGSTAEWSTINSSVELKPVAFPLMDLGLFATYTSTSLDKKGTIPATFANREEVKGSVKFANIHSVTLSNLLPNTEYEYQLVGTFEDKVYPTKTKYFKTALSEGSTNEFTVLAMTDVQAMLKSDYQNALEAFEKIEVAYDFIINCGDVVDSGKNTTQWSYSQNILSTVWGETLTVVAAGN
ncbi:MAG: metallophosphoesterase, partial [Clostridia bacterium]